VRQAWAFWTQIKSAQVMDITTVTLIQNPDVMRVAQAFNTNQGKLPALGRNTLYRRLNQQVDGATAHSPRASLDAGDD